MLDFNNPNQLKRLYSSSILLDQLVSHCLKDSDAEFLDFQQKTMKNFCSRFNADAISVIHCEMDQNGLIASVYNATSYNLVSNEMDAYRSVQHLDVTRPAILRNIGTAIFNTDFRALEEWKNSPLFQSYFRPLNVMHSVSLAFAIPFFRNRRLQFTFFKTLGSEFPETLTKDEVEFLSIPFYIAWAYRFEIIDAETLVNWLEFLNGRTPKQIFLLRSIVSMPQYSIASISNKFQMNSRLVNHHITEIYSHILPLLEDKKFSLQGNASKLVDLGRAFRFLDYVGSYRPKN